MSVSLVVGIPVCRTGDRGSIPRESHFCIGQKKN